MNSQASETSKLNKLKLSDPRAEYTKTFLQNALSRGSGTRAEKFTPLKASSILGDWSIKAKAN